MKALILAAVLGRALASPALADDLWTKPDMTNREFMKYRYTCQVYMRQEFRGQSCNPGGTNECDKFMRRCLRDFGYTRVGKDGQPKD